MTGDALKAWGWALLGSLPFFLVLVIHYQSAADHQVATGFIQGDQAIYSALGRSIFERGSWLFTHNPFDTDPQAPTIYFSLFTLLLGAITVGLKLDPGVAYVSLTVVMGVAFGRVTYALVRRCARGSTYVPLLYLLATWGGGLFTLAAVAANLYGGQAPSADLLQFDPGIGLWFLNWGRNLIFASEATYHVLVGGVWLAVLDKRYRLALCLTLLVVATHPFTAAQILAILFFWLVLSRILRVKTGASPLFTIGVVACAALFCAYYLWFLPSHPAHAKSAELWSLPWVLTWDVALFALGPVAVLALVGLWLQRAGRRELLRSHDNVFLASCFLASFLLANHDLFVRPRQPLHFTRGYIWLPLFLLGLPALHALFEWARGRLSRWSLAALVFGLLCLDNAAYIVEHHRMAGRYAFYMPRDLRDLLRQIGEQELRGVVVTPRSFQGCMAAVYTRLSPYIGSPWWTPDFEMRRAQVNHWFGTGIDPAWIDTVDYLLLPRSMIPSPKRWHERMGNASWVLFEKNSLAK